MKISKLVSTAAAGAFALGMSASLAAAETCVVALPFDFGSAAVSPTNQGLLDIVRTRYSTATVELAGYTDAVGSAASNQALSERRAATVSNYLTNGTSIAVNNSTGFGESNLIVATEGPNQLNRRVEVTIDPCNPADFNAGALPAGATLGALGGAGAAAAVLGALVVVGALGGGGTSETPTTPTTPDTPSGRGN